MPVQAQVQACAGAQECSILLFAGKCAPNTHAHTHLQVQLLLSAQRRWYATQAARLQQAHGFGRAAPQQQHLPIFPWDPATIPPPRPAQQQQQQQRRRLLASAQAQLRQAAQQGQAAQLQGLRRKQRAKRQAVEQVC